MRTKIICELASGHNGDLELLKALVRSAAENGADLVKVQDWRASNVPENDPDKKRYERYEFKDEWWPEFLAVCEETGVEPLTTCFNKDRVSFLAGLGLERVKLASISLINTELLMAAGAAFEEVILSTGMASREEIEEAADVLASNCERFALLACTAEYPMDPKDANLIRIDELREILADQEYASVGYSDHALDLDVAKAAIARGARYVEKHFSLSRSLPQIPHQMFSGGSMVTTHQVSIEPHELKELAVWRDKVAIMEGSRGFVRTEIEQKIRARYQTRYGR